MKPTEKRIFYFRSGTTQRHRKKGYRQRQRDGETHLALAEARPSLPPPPFESTWGEEGTLLLFAWCRRMHSSRRKKSRKKKRQRERERKRETAKTRTNKVPEHTSAIKGTASPASLLGTSRDKPFKPSPPRRKKRDFDEHRIRYTINCRRRYFLGDF